MLKKLKENKKMLGACAIVVVAIVVILIAILIPSMVKHAERSRAQKDELAMSEVTNAIEQAVVNQDVYDELLQYVEPRNVSYYADRETEGVAWNAIGMMRGVTITFVPEDNVVVLADGNINSLMKNPTSTKQGILGDTNGVLYNKIVLAVDDNVELTSQTYRNSPYTVFVSVGTTVGGSNAAMEDVDVYGQWGGTNILDN